jgi:hypothetical protein
LPGPLRSLPLRIAGTVRRVGRPTVAAYPWLNPPSRLVRVFNCPRHPTARRRSLDRSWAALIVSSCIAPLRTSPRPLSSLELVPSPDRPPSSLARRSPWHSTWPFVMGFHLSFVGVHLGLHPGHRLYSETVTLVTFHSYPHVFVPVLNRVHVLGCISR